MKRKTKRAMLTATRIIAGIVGVANRQAETDSDINDTVEAAWGFAGTDDAAIAARQAIMGGETEASWRDFLRKHAAAIGMGGTTAPGCPKLTSRVNLNMYLKANTKDKKAALSDAQRAVWNRLNTWIVRLQKLAKAGPAVAAGVNLLDAGFDWNPHKAAACAGQTTLADVKAAAFPARKQRTSRTSKEQEKKNTAAEKAIKEEKKKATSTDRTVKGIQELFDSINDSLPGFTAAQRATIVQSFASGSSRCRTASARLDAEEAGTRKPRPKVKKAATKATRKRADRKAGTKARKAATRKASRKAAASSL